MWRSCSVHEPAWEPSVPVPEWLWVWLWRAYLRWWVAMSDIYWTCANDVGANGFEFFPESLDTLGALSYISSIILFFLWALIVLYSLLLNCALSASVYTSSWDNLEKRLEWMNRLRRLFSTWKFPNQDQLTPPFLTFCVCCFKACFNTFFSKWMTIPL